jgi:response regulator RpfG family c-di-GMP phosphodiesterase
MKLTGRNVSWVTEFLRGGKSESGGMGGNVANCKEVIPSVFSDFEILKFLSLHLKAIKHPRPKMRNIWYVLQTNSIRREMRNRATGTGGSMKNISKPKVMLLNIPIPPLKQQQEFASRVFEIRALESSQSSSRKNLDALFQSMLHRAFQGEL